MMLMTVLIVFYVVTYFKQKLIFMGIVLFLGDLKKKKSIFHLMFTLLNKCFINVKNINGFFIVKKIGCE